MSARVVVVGGGVAGTAAAWSARRAGADVVVVLGRPGASALASGAVDDAPWPSASDAVGALDADTAVFVDALGRWTVGPARCLVATCAGVARPARGRDREVLDLAALGAGVVALPRSNRAEWDAGSLARSLSADPRARARGLSFRAFDAPSLVDVVRARGPLADVARGLDDPALVARLADALRGGAGDAIAVLVGPWLGVGGAARETLEAALGRPVGEALSPPDGPAGLRFERARDALLSSSGVAVRAGVAASAARSGARWSVTLASGEALDADAVVLATGGVVGGGFALAAAPLASDGGAAYDRASAPFVASVETPAGLATPGLTHATASSAFGVAWEDVDLVAALEGVGFATTDDGVARDVDGARLDGLRPAGDAAAAGPRTILAAAAGGVRAGVSAAG